MSLSGIKAEKRHIIRLITIIVAMCIVLLQTSNVYAAGDDGSLKEQSENTEVSESAVANGAVEILSYTLDADIARDHTYTVEESISVNLPDDTQYIEFSIPNGNFRVSNVKVENTIYQTDKGEDLSKVKIIDADKLTKGVHIYKIEYKISEYADRDSDQDIFYFDVLLPGWEQPISKVNITLNFPEDFPWDDIQYYSGQFGVQDVNNKVKFEADESAKTVHITASRLPENFGIAVKSDLPEGYWTGEIDGVWAIKAMLMFMCGALIILLIMWVIGGRDPRIRKTLQDHPVDGVTPVEIGYIFTGRIHTRDIICWIVYMAEKGYLKISEYQPKKYRLIKMAYPDGEERFLRNAYDILFENIQDNRGVDMDEIGPRLRRLRNSIEEDVASGFSSKDMLAYKPLSRAFRILGAILYGLALGVTCILRFYYEYQTPNYAEGAVVAFVAMVSVTYFCRQIDRQYFAASRTYQRDIVIAGLFVAMIPAYVSLRIGRMTGMWIVAAAVFILSIVCAGMVAIMRARARGNAELTARFMQLRHFIYHPTPKEIVKNYVADKNYYYEMVPYALMFNGLETWSISFLTLKPEPPDWYSDDIEGHAHSRVRTDNSVLNFAGDMKAFYRTMIYSYHAMVRKHRKG